MNCYQNVKTSWVLERSSKMASARSSAITVQIFLMFFIVITSNKHRLLFILQDGIHISCFLCRHYVFESSDSD